jgi:hypothetical protein
MPTISMFYGVLIQMYNNNEHNPPHFHAIYGEFKATFNFDGEVVEGSFPKKKQKLIAAWAVLHEDELNANWQLAMSGETLIKIEPLK